MTNKIEKKKRIARRSLSRWRCAVLSIKVDWLEPKRKKKSREKLRRTCYIIHENSLKINKKNVLAFSIHLDSVYPSTERKNDDCERVRKSTRVKIFNFSLFLEYTWTIVGKLVSVDNVIYFLAFDKNLLIFIGQN